MTKLIVGFDSAWSAANKGAIVAVAMHSDGSLQCLGQPQTANFQEAAMLIRQWLAATNAINHLILIDQPTIVLNKEGQRLVENIVSSPISRRKGGVQPANLKREELFGPLAPIWVFLDEFRAVESLDDLVQGHGVVETYPAMSLVALKATLDVEGKPGRQTLPKYNPRRRHQFHIRHWQHVCKIVADQLSALHAVDASQWALQSSRLLTPKKVDQDKLDSCICLITAITMAAARPVLVIGDATGFMVTSDSDELVSELLLSAAQKDPPINGHMVYRLAASDLTAAAMGSDKNCGISYACP